MRLCSSLAFTRQGSLPSSHVWWEHGLDELMHEHVGEIVSVQVTNVDAAALEEIRYERAPLEAGDVPVASLVGLLESSGYRGWYENETLMRTPRDRRLDMLRASREWFERTVEPSASRSVRRSAARSSASSR